MNLSKFRFLSRCNLFSYLLLFKKIPAVNFNKNRIYGRDGEIYDALQ